MTMKVLLVRPPRRNIWDAGLCVPPLGLAYVASALLQNGIEVRILDAYALRLSWRDFEEQIKAENADVLGLTVMTPMLDVVQRTLKLAKPYVQYTVIGGPHPTALKHTVFEEMPELDAAVVGEGEETFLTLLSWWESGMLTPVPAGVCVRGEVFSPASVPNIHQIAWPARQLLPNKSYRYLFATQRGFGTIISSRGCPFRCSFCDKSVSGSSWRARRASDVVDEMSEMVHRFGISFINFYDDNFILNSGRVSAICEEILERGLKVEWKCEGRVDGVDLELLKLMRRAGCRTIAYGVESANPETLAFLRKDIRVEQTIEAFSITKKAGLRALAYMILGAPGESVEQVQKSIDFCREIQADYVQFSSLSLMPGTPLAKKYAKAASVKNPMDSDRERPTLTDLTEGELQALMRRAWLGFYLHPRALSRISMDAIKSGSFPEGIRIALGMGRWATSAWLPS